MESERKVISVSGVVMRDMRGQVLTVRKRGTGAFMLPGGKPESGENPLNAALREVKEELEVDLEPADLDFLGTVWTHAANEENTLLRAALFLLREPVGTVRIAAELEEYRWVDSAQPGVHEGQAPLNLEHVFPLFQGSDSSEWVTLRRFTQADVEAHLAGEDAESVTWLTDGVASTLESARAWIARHQLAFDSGRDEIVFSVRVGGEPAGLVTVNQTPQGEVFQPGEVNVSYAVYPPFRGRGVGRRAVELILDFTRMLDRFTAAIVRVDAHNEPSVRLAASLSGAIFDSDHIEKEDVTMRHFRIPLAVK